MKVAIQTLVRMRLSQQRQGPDALYDIIFPAVGRLGVVDGGHRNISCMVESLRKVPLE